jgi:zinc and cadmium transporter
MQTLAWIIGATIIDSLVGLVGVFSLFINEKMLQKIIKKLVAFSAGALLGGGFFHLLVEALEKMTAFQTFAITLIGFLVFFILEEYLHWHQCEECEIHPYSYLMIIGDSAHNVLDGLVIAGTFMVSVPLGVITTVLIIAHEVPQELGVFGVLVSGGFNRSQAIFYSFVAQCTCVLGGIIGYFFMNRIDVLASLIVPFAAGGFIYIAASDLIPGMHKTEGIEKISSFAWLCAGLVLMIVTKLYLKA